MNLIDSFYQKVEEGKKGNNMGIPSGFPKLDKYIWYTKKVYEHSYCRFGCR